MIPFKISSTSYGLAQSRSIVAQIQDDPTYLNTIMAKNVLHFGK